MITSFLWNLLAFLVAISVLITLHECGHFLVARCCGVQVERFALGFGKPLWRWVDRRGTEYILAPIPLGGYVKMLDERQQPVMPAVRSRAFNHQPIWRRAAIIAAGPLANFLFAVMAFGLVFMIGVPSVRPVIGFVVPGSVADQAGLVPGLQIVSVAGVETPDWQEVNAHLIAQKGQAKIVVTVKPFYAVHCSHPNSAAAQFEPERQSLNSREKVLDIQGWHVDLTQQSAFESLGLVPKQAQIKAVLTAVETASAAQKAGLRVGDRILQVDGQPLDEWQQLVQHVRNQPQQALQLCVERAGRQFSVTLVPDAKRLSGDQVVGYAGFAPQFIPLPECYRVIHRYDPWTALYSAAKKSWHWMGLTINVTAHLLTGELGLKQLSGPIAIAQGAGFSASAGLTYYLGFLALISINLGIINLLPLPVLDGGHLLFLAIEAVLGRPVPEKVQAFCYRIGVFILLLLMGIALFNDVTRLSAG